MRTNDADVMKFHEELVVLDGTAALLTWGLTPKGEVQDPSGQGFDYYIPGVITGGAASISGLRANMAAVQTAVSFYDKLLERGYSESDCKKFLGGNFYRVFKQVWR